MTSLNYDTKTKWISNLRKHEEDMKDVVYILICLGIMIITIIPFVNFKKFFRGQDDLNEAWERHIKEQDHLDQLEHFR